MRILLASLALFLACLAPLRANTPEGDVAQLLQVFSGPPDAHNAAVESLAWKGISDARLFDLIEQKLLAEFEVARGKRAEKDRVARYVRALGFSGAPKYEATISRFTTDRDYKRVAEDALRDLENYRAWNPIIADRSRFDSQLSDDANRVINMLSAQDMMLKRVGAKRVYFGQREPAVVAVLAKELERCHTAVAREHLDAAAWLAKALGSAKDEKYRSLLEAVREQWRGRDPKLLRHAELALAAYGRPAL